MLSLLLVICITMVACVPSAYAAGGSDIVLKTVPYTGMGEIETAIPSMMDKEDEIVPLISIAEGANAFLAKITIYPGYLEDGKIVYATNLGVSVTFPDNYYGGSPHLSPTQTQNVLANFLSVAGRPAELWRMVVTYNVYNDRWGSYGKYFEFYPDGNLISPNKQSNGTIRFNMVPDTVDKAYNMVAVFKIPENTTAYYFGLTGGFWYYTTFRKKHLAMISTHMYTSALQIKIKVV